MHIFKIILSHILDFYFYFFNSFLLLFSVYNILIGHEIGHPLYYKDFSPTFFSNSYRSSFKKLIKSILLHLGLSGKKYKI